MGFPIKVSAVHDTAAYAGGVPVHILGGRVHHDIRSPFERTAVDRCREGIINDQGHSVAVGNAGKLLNIEHFERRIGDCLTKQRFRVRAESSRNLFFIGIGADECDVDAQFFHCHPKEVERSAIDGRRTDEVIACLADIEYGIEIGSLPAGSQHGSHTSFKGGNLGSYGIVRRILQAGIEVTALFKIEQTGHLLTGFVFKSSTLIDGQHARLALFRSPSCLYTQGFGLELFCHNVIEFTIILP